MATVVAQNVAFKQSVSPNRVTARSARATRAVKVAGRGRVVTCKFAKDDAEPVRAAVPSISFGCNDPG